jgi:hypothetical protein
VAGALALVKSKYPEATGNQLIQHLIHFDTDPESYAYSDDLGFGVISLRNMLANDPTGWPDVNPLMVGNPRRVIEKFPMSVYGQSDEERPTADAGTSGEDTGGGDTTAEASGTPAQAADGGSSVLPWLLGGTLAALVAVAGVVLARRFRSSGSTTRTHE